ncbi:MAG TPA: RNA methyltransferase, partial [Ilumatobacter sp.]|nr:RNA methyltransferase [Ilumatobacter sp.]
MTFILVDRADDPRLAPFRLNERGLASRANKRDDAGAGLFLAEGDLVVERAIEAGCSPHSALVDGDRMPLVAMKLADADVDVFVGGDDVRRMVTGLGMPHPIVALFHRPPRPSPAELVSQSVRLVVVEGVDNPSNIGAIVRNIAGLGWDGLLLDHTSADPWSRRSLRVAMGTAFALPHARTTDLLGTLLSLTGMTVYALTPSTAAQDIRDVRPSGPRAVIVGSERAGISDEVLAAGIPVRIPMSGGVDSLNAAAAVA